MVSLEEQLRRHRAFKSRHTIVPCNHSAGIDKASQAVDWLIDNPKATIEDAAGMFGVSQFGIREAWRNGPICAKCGKAVEK